MGRHDRLVAAVITKADLNISFSRFVKLRIFHKFRGYRSCIGNTVQKLHRLFRIVGKTLILDTVCSRRSRVQKMQHAVVADTLYTKGNRVVTRFIHLDITERRNECRIFLSKCKCFQCRLFTSRFEGHLGIDADNTHLCSCRGHISAEITAEKRDILLSDLLKVRFCLKLDRAGSLVIHRHHEIFCFERLFVDGGLRRCRKYRGDSIGYD